MKDKNKEDLYKRPYSGEQKKIVESFPSKDRGLYDEKESNNKANAGQIEEDPLEAAVKKMQLRKELRMQ